MELLTSLTPVLVIGSIVFMWGTMLYHAAHSRIPNKILWVLAILFGNFVGAIIYYLTVYRKHSPTPSEGLSNKRFIMNVAIATILIVGALSVNSSLQPVPRKDNISFEQAINLANNGEIKQIDVTS